MYLHAEAACKKRDEAERSATASTCATPRVSNVLACNKKPVLAAEGYACSLKLAGLLYLCF